jgi:hypothetical protein
VAIHRVGLLLDNMPGRVDLGRVLVTIDDLGALIDILSQQANGTGSVKVYFSGGYFTRPEDLRQLSDDEITPLKVRSDNAEVNLEPTQAVAIGDHTTTVKILNTWARMRQTRLGTSRARSLKYLIISLYLCGGALITMLTIANAAKLGSVYVVPLSIVAVLTVMGAGLTPYWYNMAVPLRGAVVRPMSLHEFRQLQSNNQYPRASWIVAIVAVIVAVLAIGANFVVPLVAAH